MFYNQNKGIVCVLVVSSTNIRLAYFIYRCIFLKGWREFILVLIEYQMVSPGIITHSSTKS